MLDVLLIRSATLIVWSQPGASARRGLALGAVSRIQIGKKHDAVSNHGSEADHQIRMGDAAIFSCVVQPRYGHHVPTAASSICHRRHDSRHFSEVQEVGFIGVLAALVLVRIAGEDHGAVGKVVHGFGAAGSGSIPALR